MIFYRFTHKEDKVNIDATCPTKYYSKLRLNSHTKFNQPIFMCHIQSWWKLEEFWNWQTPSGVFLESGNLDSLLASAIDYLYKTKQAGGFFLVFSLSVIICITHSYFDYNHLSLCLCILPTIVGPNHYNNVLRKLQEICKVKVFKQSVQYISNCWRNLFEETCKPVLN